MKLLLMLVALPLSQGQPHADIEKLIRLLGEEDQQVRDDATRKLIALGEDAVPLVEKARDHKDAEVTSRARQILDSIYRPLNDLPQRTRARLKEVEERIAPLQKAGRDKESEALDRSFRETRRQILSGKPTLAEGPEVHVVGVHDARKAGGLVNVQLTYTDRPMILVLCAYNRTTWEVKTATGVKLEKVIVGGYHIQDVKVLPKDVPVLKKVYEDGGGEEYFQAFKVEDERYPDMVRKVKKLTGKPISTFLGSYAPPNDPICVGPENPSWRSQRLVPLVDRLYEGATREAREVLAAEMRKLRFTAVHLAQHPLGLTSGPFGEFTPLGPLGKTLKPVKTEGPSGLMAVVTDPVGGKTYGITSHQVIEIEAENGASKDISPKADDKKPRMSWPQAIAFDSKRKRLLVTNAAGATGHLWAFDPAKAAWSVLADMDRPHITGLAYGAVDDVLYGVGSNGRTPGFFTVLYRFNPDGALLDSVQLADPIRAGGAHRERAQVVSLDKDRLVLLVGPLLNPDDGPENVNCAYVLNPKTGELIFSCVQRAE